MLEILLHPLTAVALAILIVALIAGVVVLYVLMGPESRSAIADRTAFKGSPPEHHTIRK